MPRFPRISDTPDRYDRQGRKRCRNCDEPVAAGRRHYCSQRCMDAFNRDRTWAFVRSDVLRRDGYRCGICKRRFPKALLDVDHILPLQLGGVPFDKANLRALCKACHKAKSALDREAIAQDKELKKILL